MAVHHSTPPLNPAFSQLLDNPAQPQSRCVDSVLAKSHLGTCEYEDDFVGCGAVATVTELDSQREYCLRHFLVTNGNAESIKPVRRECLLRPKHAVLNSETGSAHENC